MPAAPAYAALVDALGSDADPVVKDLELYAGPQPPAGYSLDDEADGILRAAETAGFERFHLLGYSGGGAASAWFASRHPARLLSLALLEPAWLGNEGLGPEEAAAWRTFEELAQLPDAEMMPAFVRAQVAPGVEPPAPPPGPPPPWMALRPPALRVLIGTFLTATLDVDALRAVTAPVYFGLGGRSNPDYFARCAERAAGIFGDFTLDVYEERHHFDPPHRTEPERLAGALRELWARAPG